MNKPDAGPRALSLSALRLRLERGSVRIDADEIARRLIALHNKAGGR